MSNNVPAQSGPAQGDQVMPASGTGLSWDAEEQAWAKEDVPDHVWDPSIGEWRFRSPRMRPTGPQGKIGADGYAMAKVGATIAALGGEHALVLKILSTLQEITIQAFVSGQPVILNDLSKLFAGQLNTLMQDIRNMRAVQIPQTQGFLGRLSGTIDPNSLIEYVPKGDVLTIIANYINKLPHHTS